MSRLVLFLSFFSLVLSEESFAQDRGLTAELERVSSLSTKDMLDYTVEAEKEQNLVAKDVEKLLEYAEKDEDEETQTCVRSSLDSIRTLQEVSRLATDTFQSYLNDGENDLANMAFRKVAVARTKSRQLRSQAEACLGEGAGLEDETQIGLDGKFEGDQGLEASFEEGLNFDKDPPDVSPFM